MTQEQMSAFTALMHQEPLYTPGWIAWVALIGLGLIVLYAMIGPNFLASSLLQVVMTIFTSLGVLAIVVIVSVGVNAMVLQPNQDTKHAAWVQEVKQLATQFPVSKYPVVEASATDQDTMQVVFRVGEEAISESFNTKEVAFDAVDRSYVTATWVPAGGLPASELGDIKRSVKAGEPGFWFNRALHVIKE